MANIQKHDDTFIVGKDFVEAITGTYVSHGRIGYSTSIHPWVSTLPIAETEHLFRVAAKSEGVSINYFESQVID
jgi:hypothetical protein